MGNLVSAVLSLWLFLLKEKSVIYHLGGRDKEDWGAETHDFQGELKGHQSTPTCYKGGGLKKIACQSTSNIRGTITILKNLRGIANKFILLFPNPRPIHNDQSMTGLRVIYQFHQLHSIAGCRSLQL